ncbi:unnamed protein product, partial [Symbiodinium sp. KB8]
MADAKLPEKVHFAPCKEAAKIGRELAKEASLRHVGVNIITDTSPNGKLMKNRKYVTRKDVIANPRVIAAVVRGYGFYKAPQPDEKEPSDEDADEAEESEDVSADDADAPPKTPKPQRECLMNDRLSGILEKLKVLENLKKVSTFKREATDKAAKQIIAVDSNNPAEPHCLYKPAEFQEERFKFINRMKEKKGISYHEDVDFLHLFAGEDEVGKIYPPKFAHAIAAYVQRQPEVQPVQPRLERSIDWSKTDFEIFVAELDAGNWDNPLCDTVVDLALRYIPKPCKNKVEDDREMSMDRHNHRDPPQAQYLGHIVPSDLPMGKDIGKVLKAGTAFKGALKEAKNGRGSSKAIDLEVPLNTEFCGTTLKKLMKDEGITRQEATAVFMAWKESCDEQGLPSGPALKQKPSKVLKGRKAEDEKPPTRIRGKAAPPNKRPAPETESGKSSKKAKASTDDESRVFAPANAQEVADFFGIEKEKLLKKNKKKQPESSEVVEDLDGESWDEAEGCGEEREEEEFDWEAAYPGFWDDYWEHKYGSSSSTFVMGQQSISAKSERLSPGLGLRQVPLGRMPLPRLLMMILSLSPLLRDLLLPLSEPLLQPLYQQPRINARVRVNVSADEAFMATLGSSGLPSVLHRSAPGSSAHPLNGDVLKAFDKYNTGLQQAVSQCQELKKEINSLSNLMLDLGDSPKEKETKTILTAYEKKLKKYAQKLPALNEFKELKTSEEMDPQCQRIHDQVVELGLEKAQARALVLARSTAGGDNTITLACELGAAALVQDGFLSTMVSVTPEYAAGRDMAQC